MQRKFWTILAIMAIWVGFAFDGSSPAQIIPADRNIDWMGNAGLNFTIPSWPNSRDAKTDDGAVGDGEADDTAAINNCIRNASENSCCYIPSGTYKVTDTINLASFKCLKGAGPNSTTINAVGLTGDVVAAFGYGNSQWMSLTGGYTKGSSRIYVNAGDANLPNYTAGSLIMIDQANGSVDEGTPGYMGNTLGQMNVVIGQGANYLDLARPLYASFDAAYSPQVSRFWFTIYKAGVQDLKIARTGGNGGNNIHFAPGRNCWVKNVKSIDVWNWHVKLESCWGCVVQDSWFEQVNQLNCGGNACYGVTVFAKSSDNLIENNIFVRMRHALITEYGGTGNIYGYNYSVNPINEAGNATDWLMGDVELHGGYPYMNLFEGNIVAHIHAAYTLGSAGYDTFLRNNVTTQAQAAVKYNLSSVDNGWANFYHNYVGNIYGTAGFTAFDRAYRSPWGCSDDGCSQADSRLVNGATLLRHGNYSFKQDLGSATTNYVEWDPTISDRTIPNSYYYVSKPAFFGNCAWPPIGPDLDPMVNILPAEARYEGSLICGGVDTTPPAAPSGLTVN